MLDVPAGSSGGAGGVQITLRQEVKGVLVVRSVYKSEWQPKLAASVIFRHGVYLDCHHKFRGDVDGQTGIPLGDTNSRPQPDEQLQEDESESQRSVYGPIGQL